MVKAKKFDFDFDTGEYCQPASREKFHFDLYLRNREMAQVYAVLDEVRQKPKIEKEQFLKQQGDFLDELALEIWDQVQNDLREVSIDQQSLELIAQYTGQVRDTFNLLRELKSSAPSKSTI